jgi:hypothetical protein
MKQTTDQEMSSDASVADAVADALTSSSPAPQGAMPALPEAATDAGTFVAPLLNPEVISKLSDGDLIAVCKSQYNLTDSSYSIFRKDKELLATIYDEMVGRFRDENLKGDKRDGNPTLKQAFALAGWNYDAARKFRQRHEQDKKRRMLTAYENPSKPLKVTEGDTVKVRGKQDPTVYVVMNVHESATKADIAPKDNADANTVTVPTESLKKANSPVKKVKAGDRILCEDTGVELVYEGQGKFSRAKTPSLLEQKGERELACIKAKEQHEKAKGEEKERQKELRQAESARRDLDKLAEKERRKAEVEAKKQAARKKKAESAAKKTARTKIQPAAKTNEKEKVLVARIGDTNEFGVFPQSKTEHTSAKALAIGTRHYCEAERDRINAKRVVTAGSLGNLGGAVNGEASREVVEAL